MLNIAHILFWSFIIGWIIQLCEWLIAITKDIKKFDDDIIFLQKINSINFLIKYF